MLPWLCPSSIQPAACLLHPVGRLPLAISSYLLLSSQHSPWPGRLRGLAKPTPPGSCNPPPTHPRILLNLCVSPPQPRARATSPQSIVAPPSPQKHAPPIPPPSVAHRYHPHPRLISSPPPS